MKRPARSANGFTLVEMLVAITVLAILIFIIVQVTDATSKTISISNRQVDAASQARRVFGCLSEDLSGLVKRPDVPFVALNSSMNFLSYVESADPTLSSSTNRNLSFVAYQMALSADNLGLDNNPRPCLVRAGKAISWTTSGYFGLDATGMPPGNTIPVALQPQSADFDVLAPGVVRFIIGFQLYPDDKPVILQDNTSIANSMGQVVYSPPVHTLTAYGGSTSLSVIDLSRISSLVVGVVVIDLNNLRLLNSAQVTALGAAFATPANDTLPVASWGTKVSSAASLPPSIPLPVRQSLRVFQHFYPITPYGYPQ